jgi:hypothetical protein
MKSRPDVDNLRRPIYKTKVTPSSQGPNDVMKAHNRSKTKVGNRGSANAKQMAKAIKIRVETAGDTVLDASAKQQDTATRLCKVEGQYRPHVIKVGGLVASKSGGLMFQIGGEMPMCSAADQRCSKGDIITWARA